MPYCPISSHFFIYGFDYTLEIQQKVSLQKDMHKQQTLFPPYDSKIPIHKKVILNIYTVITP